MPLPEIKLKALLAVLALTHTSDAFFRNLMIGETAFARIDPIVNEGEPSPHAHHLTGGNALSFESTGDSLSASECTNSLITVDKSAYWAPSLYFEHQNGSFESVQLALGLTAYYKYETRPQMPQGADFSVFPKGLKMIAGTTDKRTWDGPWPVPAMSLWGKEDESQNSLAEKALGFNCLNYQTHNEDSFAFPYLRSKDFLDSNCANGVRAEIIFPSCWDGENLDSKDHKSHVAYPSLIQDGKCPDGYPVYLPILFYETIWNTQAFSGLPGQFIFSNGDPTGYGYHADFIAAWDDGIQESVKADSQCTNSYSDGEISSCPVFNGKTQSQAEARACKLTLPNEIASEVVDGVLDELPGDVKIKGTRHDPGNAVATSEAWAPSTSIPAARSSAMATHTGSYQFGGDTSAAVVSTSAAVESTWASWTALPTALPTTMAKSIAQVGQVGGAGQISEVASSTAESAKTITTTYTSGKYVVEMVIVQMYTTVTAAGPEPAAMTQHVDGDASGANAQARRRRHLHQHRHGHDLS